MNDLKVYVVIVDDNEKGNTRGRVATVAYPLVMGSPLTIHLHTEDMIFFGANGWTTGDDAYIIAQPRPFNADEVDISFYPNQINGGKKFEGASVVQTDLALDSQS